MFVSDVLEVELNLVKRIVLVLCFMLCNLVVFVEEKVEFLMERFVFGDVFGLYLVL